MLDIEGLLTSLAQSRKVFIRKRTFSMRWLGRFIRRDRTAHMHRAL